MLFAILGAVLGAALLLFLLYLLALRPGKRRAEIAAFTAWRYAHRGLYGDGVPENSLAAFRAACDAGYAIELDVQLSRDGVPVVFHDATLDRVCGVAARVQDLDAETLTHTILSGCPGHTIPTLSDVLATVDGRVPLLIEIKGAREAADVCRVAIAQLDAYRGPWCMESFSPYAVRWFRENRPAVLRGQLSDRLWADRRYRNIGTLLIETFITNFLTRPDFVAYNFHHRHYFPFRLVRGLWRAPAFAWTVRSEEDAALCQKDFETIIFEHYIPAAGPRVNHDAQKG